MFPIVSPLPEVLRPDFALTNFDTSAIRARTVSLFGVVRAIRHKRLGWFGNPTKHRRLLRTPGPSGTGQLVCAKSVVRARMGADNPEHDEHLRTTLNIQCPL